MRYVARLFFTGLTVCAMTTSLSVCSSASAPTLSAHPLPSSPVSIDEADPSDLHSARPGVLGEDTHSGNLGVSITSLTPDVIDEGSTLTVSGRVVNLSDSPATSATVLRLAMTPHSVVSTSELSEYFSGRGDAGVVVAEHVISRQLRPHESAEFAVSVPADGLPLDDTFEWGPRGISVEAGATTSDGQIEGNDRSVIVWDSHYERQATPVSVLVPFTSAQARGSTQQWNALTALAHTPGVTLAVDPEALTAFVRTGVLSADGYPRSVVSPSGGSPAQTQLQAPSQEQPQSQSQSLRESQEQSGTDASEGAQSDTTGTQSGAGDPNDAHAFPHWPVSGQPTPSWWHQRADHTFIRHALDSLVGSGGQVVALPSADADVVRLRNMGNSELAAVAQASMNVFGTLSTPDQVARESASHDASTPSGSGVSVIGSVLWPHSSAFGASMLPDAAGRVIIAPPGHLAPSQDESFTSVARVEVDADTGHTHTDGASESTRTVLTGTEELSELLAWHAPTDADRLDAAQAAQALGALITRQLPNVARPQFVAVARGSAIDEDLVSRVRALVGRDWMAPLSFAQIATSEPTDTVRHDVQPTPPLTEQWRQALDTISDARAGASALAAALTQPNEFTHAVELATLSAVSADHDDDRVATEAHALRLSVHQLYSLVHAEPSATINLINKTAAFPVRVTNELPWAITVTATLKPDDPRLRATPSTAHTVDAHSTDNVEVPVEAIGSGNIDVTYVVATERGTILDNSQSVMVRLRAQWEDIGTWSIAALVALAFCVGLIRTVRSRWRSRETLFSPTRSHTTHTHDGGTK